MRGRAATFDGPARTLWIAVLLVGCGRVGSRPEHAPAVVLPLQVLADTARTTKLPVPPPDSARAWLESVQRAAPPRAARIAPPASGALDLPAPEARPAPPPISREPSDVLVVDDDLHPPIPIGVTPLRSPPAHGRPIGVDLDVRVDESGDVSDALWAAGSEDSLAVAAATACALAMKFHPALQRGRPVAVWCRQHFEFGGGAARMTEESSSR